MGVRGFFTSCATWRAMSAQAARRLLRSRSRRWACEVARHLVEGLHQPPQLVLAGGLHARLEVALGDAPRRARQLLDGPGDAAGHGEGDARGQAEEEDGGQADGAVEVVHRRLDLALPEGEGHREHAVLGPAHVDGHGGDEVREVADALGLQGRGLAFEHDRAVDGARHARGEQAGGVQLALAGRDQVPVLEEVEVVLHHGGEPHEGRVRDRLRAGGLLALEERVVLDRLLGHGRALQGLVVRFLAQACADEAADHHLQDGGGDEGDEGEGDEEAQGEATAHRGQQRGQRQRGPRAAPSAPAPPAPGPGRRAA